MGRAAYERFTCVCGARCTMLPHERTGALAPITDAADPAGNVAIVSPGPAGRVVYRIVPAGERALLAGQLHLNHFSNCPERAAFRRR